MDLSDDVVRAILQDREGNIWVGTNNGLDRFRKTNLVPVVLPFKPQYAVLAAGDAGDVWVANHGFHGPGSRVDAPIALAIRFPDEAYICVS